MKAAHVTEMKRLNQQRPKKAKKLIEVNVRQDTKKEQVVGQLTIKCNRSYFSWPLQPAKAGQAGLWYGPASCARWLPFRPLNCSSGIRQKQAVAASAARWWKQLKISLMLVQLQKCLKLKMLFFRKDVLILISIFGFRSMKFAHTLRVWNKPTLTLINFLTFFQGL